MNKEKTFWGLLFIVAGIFIIVNRLGYFEGINLFSVILTVFLVPYMVRSIRYMHFSGILFPAAFLCIIYDDVLGITSITPWPVLGAALLGSIGLSIIFHDRHHYRRYKGYVNDEHFQEIIDEADDSSFFFESKFGSTIKYVNAEDFKQADLSCSFGAMKVYFDNAVIRGDNAVIALDVSFAGVELFIPKQWNVVNKANTSFGAIEEKNKNQSTGVPTVTLVGNSSFAGITIIYV
ncbi:LiaF transmembrane domain-containing protein [Konateibacter massiliensis]|uniref:LiaF transmembrane domain-containing protein n=1 Tax=Konateibacter massiliensis TaxID=2002841 RepID=UPI000C146E50|nr:hypothetical protein [Konateibacter massiliensis]